MLFSSEQTTGVDISVKAVHIPGTDVTVVSQWPGHGHSGHSQLLLYCCMQELYIHDCAGKEIFSDYVQQFVSQTLLVHPLPYPSLVPRGYPHPFCIKLLP